jgi:uncharacterized repeat protein (TIGR01451 family)
MLATASSALDPSARGHDVRIRCERRWRGVRGILCGLLALTVMAIAAPAASAAPWPCDGAGYVTMYRGTVGEQTLLTRVVREPDGTYGFENRGTAPGRLINSIAFRAQDGFIYAWENNPNPGLVRIEDNGAGGSIIGPSQPIGDDAMDGFGSFAGTFLPDGRYFVWGTPANPVGFIIHDVTNPATTAVTQVNPNWDASGGPNGLPIGDFAVNPADGNLYAVLGGRIRQLTLSGSTLQLGGDFGPGSEGSPGVQWFSPAGAEGTMIYSDPHPDNTVHLASTDMASGAVADLGSVGQAVPNGDGTACANTLAVTKDASPRTVTAGGELTYTYTIVARGLVDNPVDFVDQLPAGMTYVPGGVTVNGTFGSPNAYGGTDTLSISGVIPRNTTVTISARVAVAASAPCNADVPNQAQATMHAAGLPDVTIMSDDPTTPNNPTDPTVARVNCPPPPPPPPPVYDMQLTKTSDDQRVRVGETLTYTLTARNNGPDGAPAGYVLSDPVPEQFRVLDVRADSGAQCDRDGRDVRCTMPAMAVGAELEVRVRVRAIEPGGTRNRATLVPPLPPPNVPPCTSCDPPENNTDEVPVRIVKPTLGLTKGVNKKSVRAGETVIYTIRTRNPSNTTLRNVRTCDDLPPELVFVSATPRAALRNGQYCWTEERLRPGQRVTYKLTARAVQGISPGRKVNRATATSPDAKTKRARRSVRVPTGGAVQPGGVTG